MLLARAPDLFVSMNADACMNLPLVRGVLLPLTVPSSSWSSDATGIHGNQSGSCGPSLREDQAIGLRDAEFAGSGAYIALKFPITTISRCRTGFPFFPMRDDFLGHRHLRSRQAARNRAGISSFGQRRRVVSAPFPMKFHPVIRPGGAARRVRGRAPRAKTAHESAHESAQEAPRSPPRGGCAPERGARSARLLIARAEKKVRRVYANAAWQNCSQIHCAAAAIG